jgi:hypothetical protein
MTIAKNSRTKSEIVAISTDDAPVTLYTCPANSKAHMSLLFITNASTNASDINVQWYRASVATSFFIIGGKNLTQGEFIKFDGSFIVLEAGDYVTVETTSTAGSGVPDTDAFCTVEEFFNPVGG